MKHIGEKNYEEGRGEMLYVILYKLKQKRWTASTEQHLTIKMCIDSKPGCLQHAEVRIEFNEDSLLQITEPTELTKIVNRELLSGIFGYPQMNQFIEPKETIFKRMLVRDGYTKEWSYEIRYELNESNSVSIIEIAEQSRRVKKLSL